MKKRKILLLLALCALSACREENPETAASDLLRQARQATEQQLFAEAHLLIDSLRTTYPKAVRTRWAALDFEDSLNLAEARLDAAFAKDVFDGAQRLVDTLRAAGLIEIDEPMKVALAKLDTARQENQRQYMKVRFFEKKIERKHEGK